jgi:hypothetical protein
MSCVEFPNGREVLNNLQILVIVLCSVSSFPKWNLNYIFWTQLISNRCDLVPIIGRCSEPASKLRLCAVVEISGHSVVQDHHFLGKDDHVMTDGSPSDDHVLTDGSPSDDLIFALVIVLNEEGLLCFGRDYHVFQRWWSFRQLWHSG